MKKTATTLAIALALSGCTQSFVTELSPQSHFDYPNSNVYPLGKVEGKASTTSFGIPDQPSSLEFEAISNALRQKPGADMVINAYHIMDVTQLLILPIYTTTYRVEGTAAKMSAGTQAIH